MIGNVVSKLQSMQNLFRYSNALIADVSLGFTRYLYDAIKWDDILTICPNFGEYHKPLHEVCNKFES